MVFRELALFAGIGGSSLAGKLAGWETVCAVENDEYCRSILFRHQRNGTLPRFPIWDDVETFDPTPWTGSIDLITGGFPCQDISLANKTEAGRKGLDGARSGLWREMLRIICVVRPDWVLVENVPALLSNGMGTVLADLSTLGYDAIWGVLSAGDLGYPHLRQRVWVVAHPASKRFDKHAFSIVEFSKEAASKHKPRISLPATVDILRDGRKNFSTAPDYNYRGHDGLSEAMDRIKGLGNAWVPNVAAAAFIVLHTIIEMRLTEE